MLPRSGERCATLWGQFACRLCLPCQQASALRLPTLALIAASSLLGSSGSSTRSFTMRAWQPMRPFSRTCTRPPAMHACNQQLSAKPSSKSCDCATSIACSPVQCSSLTSASCAAPPVPRIYRPRVMCIPIAVSSPSNQHAHQPVNVTLGKVHQQHGVRLLGVVARHPPWVEGHAPRHTLGLSAASATMGKAVVGHLRHS